METVDITTANAGTKIALRANIVSLPTPVQVEILVTSLLIITSVIAVIMEQLDAVSIVLSATVVAVIAVAIFTWVGTTLILYANITTWTTRDGIAVISLPIMVITVSTHTSLFVTLTVELTLNYNTEQADVAEAVAEITTAAERMAQMAERAARARAWRAIANHILGPYVYHHHHFHHLHHLHHLEEFFEE